MAPTVGLRPSATSVSTDGLEPTEGSILTGGTRPTVGTVIPGAGGSAACPAESGTTAAWTGRATRFSISTSASGLAYAVGSSVGGRRYNVLMLPLSTASFA